MRLKLSESPRPEVLIGSGRNSESSATIPRGTPVILNLSSTPQPTTDGDGFAKGYEDGLQVVLPGTAGANPCAMYPFGIALQDTPSQQLGEFGMYGVFSYVLVVRATRSASSASWSSSASSSSAGGFLLSIDTLAQAFATYAPSSITISNASAVGSAAGINIQNQQINAVMLDSFSSLSASATATSDTRTSIVQGYRCFVRWI